MKRVYRAWSHCLLGKITSCEILELVQKCILCSEACLALSLGAVGCTLATQMAQGAPEVPGILLPGSPQPSLSPESDFLSSFQNLYFP